MLTVLTANGPSGYSIANSLRFRSSASAYLNRTFGTPTGAQKGTFSFWLKRGRIGTDQELMGAGASYYDQFQFQSDQIRLVFNAAADGNLRTTAVFRDPSAWYHVVLSVDTTQTTAANRALIYVNGVSQALTITTNITQNLSPKLFSNVIHYIGCYAGGTTTNNLDGYMADINFIDGQALTPSSFGAFDSITGVWQPIRYSGTYGTNGFKLNFSNGTSTTTLGYDSSGNSNNWTTNNISLTAGSTYDWMIDSPTPFAGSSYGVGNYCVMNAVSVGSDCTLSNGNLGLAYGSSTRNCTMGTIGMSSGKWYCEFAFTSGGGTYSPMVGLSSKASSTDMPNYPGYNAYGWGYLNDGDKYTNTTGSAYGATWTFNDVIGVAFDADAGTLTFYKNGASQGTAFTGLTSGPYYFAVGDGSTLGTYTGWINFGQRPFAYTPPSGYKSLCTYNLPTPTIQNGANYMAATTYTGTGSSLSVSNAVTSVSFQPDFVWIKSRSAATDHALYDVIRGTQNRLESNTTDAAVAADNGLTAFNSNGFTVNTLAQVNTNAATYVGWQWKAGGTAVTNTAGSITSQVSANTTSGFSVVTYTGNGSSGATVGHGLGVAPSMVIVKRRDSAGSWWVYSNQLTSADYTLRLNATLAQTSVPGIFNSTAPTSSVVTLGNSGDVNDPSAAYVAYCFAAISGYSAFGSYTGNGSTDGTFVYCGFRPRYVLIKRTDTTADWIVWDTARNPYNAATSNLYPDLANAEYTDPSVAIDFVASGFKLRNTNIARNASGGTYIYAAFAENPFTNALAR